MEQKLFDSSGSSCPRFLFVTVRNGSGRGVCEKRELHIYSTVGFHVIKLNAITGYRLIFKGIRFSYRTSIRKCCKLDHILTLHGISAIGTFNGLNMKTILAGCAMKTTAVAMTVQRVGMDGHQGLPNQ